MSVRDVIIVGGGPSGLATAIAAKHFNLDYVVLEQGALVDGIVRFPINMVFFTTPELLEIGGLPMTTPYEKPTRAEALMYYRKVVDTFQLQVSLFEKVLAIANHVGLLAEEYDPRRRRMVGNFPQAFSHVALINTAYNLAHAAKPAAQRST